MYGLISWVPLDVVQEQRAGVRRTAGGGKGRANTGGTNKRGESMVVQAGMEQSEGDGAALVTPERETAGSCGTAPVVLRSDGSRLMEPGVLFCQNADEEASVWSPGAVSCATALSKAPTPPPLSARLSPSSDCSEGREGLQCAMPDLSGDCAETAHRQVATEQSSNGTSCSDWMSLPMNKPSRQKAVAPKLQKNSGWSWWGSAQTGGSAVQPAGENRDERGEDNKKSCKEWMGRPTSFAETLMSDVTRCRSKGVVVSYLHADSKITPLFTM